MNPTAIAFAPVFAARLAGILAGLAAVVAAHFRTLGPLTLPLWTRISRASRRLVRLMAHVEQGRLPRRDPRRNRQRQRKPPPAGPAVPHAHLWLIKTLGYQAAGCAWQLRHLLELPESRALLEAAPTMARTLRPLCRLLGVDLPGPPKPAPAPQAPSPETPPADPPPPAPAPPEPPRFVLPDPPCPHVRWPWFHNPAAKPA
jgi:HAMP domain-containing protein